MISIRRALYGKLSGDTTLNALLGTPAPGYSKSVYYQQAPQGATFPYVIFNDQAQTPRFAFSAKAYDNDIWLIKGVDRNSSSADRVDSIKDRLEELLTDGSLSISGGDHLYLRPESSVGYPETADGVLYRHSGWNFRVIYD